MTGTHVDAYALKARWLPAALATTPIVVLMISTFELDALLGIAGPTVTSLLFGVAAGEIVRSRGKAVERSLVREWQGFPTTRALRARSDADPERRRRRKQVEAVSGRQLPSLLEQENLASESDAAIEQIVRTALAVLRRDEGKDFDVLHNENISYGFRRNLLALRPFGLVIAVLATVFTLVMAFLDVLTWPIATPILVVQIVVATLWLVVAKPDWVREQADTFCDRFFIALDVAAARPSPRSMT